MNTDLIIGIMELISFIVMFKYSLLIIGRFFRGLEVDSSTIWVLAFSVGIFLNAKGVIG